MLIILIGSAYNFNMCAKEDTSSKSRKIGMVLNLISLILVLTALIISFFENK